MKLLNYNRRFLFLPTMLLAATFASAQTDSTKVKNATPHSDQRSENDSVTWNQSLDGVTVTAQRQLIKQDIDRIGYDVQTLTASATTYRPTRTRGQRTCSTCCAKCRW